MTERRNSGGIGDWGVEQDEMKMERSDKLSGNNGDAPLSQKCTSSLL